MTEKVYQILDRISDNMNSLDIYDLLLRNANNFNLSANDRAFFRNLAEHQYAMVEFDDLCAEKEAAVVDLVDRYDELEELEQLLEKSTIEEIKEMMATKFDAVTNTHVDVYMSIYHAEEWNQRNRRTKAAKHTE